MNRSTWTGIVCAALCGTAFGATSVVVDSGSRELAVSENTDGYTFDVRDGAALRLPATQGDFDIQFYLIATNGTGTIDCSAVTGSVRFKNGVRARTTSTLVVKGKDRVDVGCDVASVGYNYSALRWNVPTIAFQDSDGNAIASPEGVRLVGGVAPTALAAPVTIAPGASILLFESEACSVLFGGQNQVTLDGYDLMLCANAVVGYTFTVKPGSRLRVKTLKFSNADAWSPSSPGGTTFKCNVVLDGEGAAVPPELWFCSNKPEVLDGSLTGFGDVYDMVGYGNDSQGAESKVLGPVAFTGGVYLPNGKQRITLGAAASGLHITNVSTTVKGLLAISSATHGDVSVTVDAMTAGSDVALMENVSATLPAGTVAIRDGALEHHVMVPTAGLIDDFANIPFSSGTWSIVADASLTSISNLPKAASLKVGTGASVTMQMPDSSSVLAADGTLTLTEADDWRTKAAIWIDPSRTDLISGLGSGVLTQSAAYTNAYYTAYGTFEPLNTRLSGKLLVEQVADCRTGMRVAYNPRLYHNNAISKQPQVYLYLQGDGPNGNSYFNGGVYNKRQTGSIYVDEIGSGTSAYSGSMNDVRRVPFTTQIAAQYVTVVYNSANGGGWELIGTANGEFLRSTNTLDVGVMKTDSYEMWIDGVKVARPSTARFSGGWQVVTVKAAGVSLTGLGYTKNTYNHCGGQYWGDVLVFSEVITDAQRIAMEKTLAAKWGITYNAEARSAVQLTGSGTVNVVNDMELRGNFAGTVNLSAGATLAIPDERLPYGEAEIPSEGRVGWFDPDDTSSLVWRGANYPLEIFRIYDHALGTDANTSLYGSGSRAPHLAVAPRGLGPERGWVDYNDLLSNRDISGGTALNQGNVLRLVQSPNSSTQKAWDVRTGFIIQDSLRGGGTPFACDIDASKSKQVTRRSTATPSDRIYNSGTTNNLTQGGIWLNGAARNIGDGFTGGPELFAFQAKDDTIPLLCFAQYANSECDATTWSTNHLSAAGKWIGEIQGEILLYSTTLTDDVRNGISAYLMGKWLGFLPEGYSDSRNATIAGAGTVTVPSKALMPKFAPSFTGEVQLAGGGMAFTVDAAGNVTDAISIPSGTLSLPAAVTVNVSFAAGPRPGSYLLVDAATLGTTEWTHSVTPAGHAACALRTDSGKLYLDVFPNGTMIIFK